MRSRQLYATVTATSAGVTYTDVPDATRIRAIQWSILGTGLTSADYIQCEVSLQAASQNTVNDAQGVLSAASAGTITSLNTGAAINFEQILDVKVAAGTRVYLNSVESGGGTWLVKAILFYD